MWKILLQNNKKSQKTWTYLNKNKFSRSGNCPGCLCKVCQLKIGFILLTSYSSFSFAIFFISVIWSYVYSFSWWFLAWFCNIQKGYQDTSRICLFAYIYLSVLEPRLSELDYFCDWCVFSFVGFAYIYMLHIYHMHILHIYYIFKSLTLWNISLEWPRTKQSN